MGYLSGFDLLTCEYGPADLDDDLELRGRDRDYVQLVKRILTSSEGVYLPALISECVKGQYIRQCRWFDGSDPDYQLTHWFLNDLDGHDPQLIKRRQSDGMMMVTPTIRLPDLISEGVTQTTRKYDDLLYDRHFCENYLRTANKVDGWDRDLLRDSLHRYLKRIENYQLLLDVHFCERRGGDTTRRMTKQYNTCSNSQGRLRKTWVHCNNALEHAYGKYDNVVLMTLTVDPNMYNDPTRSNPCSLHDGASSVNPNFNRLFSYFDSDPSMKNGTRKDGVPS